MMSELNKDQKRTLRKIRDLMILGDLCICGEYLRIVIENIEIEIDTSTISDRTISKILEAEFV